MKMRPSLSHHCAKSGHMLPHPYLKLKLNQAYRQHARFVTGRVHEAVSHPLYEVHWVWGGKTLESKQAAMREAGKFSDEEGTKGGVWMMQVWMNQICHRHDETRAWTRRL